MEKTVCWGILRETEHSPDREWDDSAILKETADKVEQVPNCEVFLFTPEEILRNPPSQAPDLVFFMCETKPLLALLENWQEQGAITINTPESVRNTYRFKTVELLQEQDYFPPTGVLSTDAASFDDFKPIWIKRFDFHAVHKDDVCFAESPSELKAILGRLRERNVERVLIQQNIEGDLVKFYGIGDSWFQHFYHKDQDLKSYPFDAAKLQAITKKSAQLLGLEIYGGDAIINPDGDIFLIDLNAWPSFALYRDIASGHIAELILQKVKGRSGVTR